MENMISKKTIKIKCMWSSGGRVEGRSHEVWKKILDYKYNSVNVSTLKLVTYKFSSFRKSQVCVRSKNGPGQSYFVQKYQGGGARGQMEPSKTDNSADYWFRPKIYPLFRFRPKFRLKNRFRPSRGRI